MSPSGRRQVRRGKLVRIARAVRLVYAPPSRLHRQLVVNMYPQSSVRQQVQIRWIVSALFIFAVIFVVTEWRSNMSQAVESLQFHAADVVQIIQGGGRNLSAAAAAVVRPDLRPEPLLVAEESAATCGNPLRHLVFIKVHKSASSTVQNVLLRYSYRFNITLAFPKRGNLIGWPNPVDKKFLRPPPPGLKYEMMIHHMVYSQSALDGIMPGDTRYIAVVRDPAVQFQSYYWYMGLYKEQYLGISLNEFADNPYVVPIPKPKNPSGYGRPYRNPQLYDLGLNVPESMNNEEARLKVVDYIRNVLDKRFSLVMIADQMEESMILLDQMLCGRQSTMEEIVGLDFLVRASRPGNITEQQIESLYVWNWADSLLYRHFVKRLDLQMELYGRQEMVAALDRFRERRITRLSECGVNMDKPLGAADTAQRKTLFVRYNHKPPSDDDDCKMMGTSELRLHDMLLELRWKGLGGVESPDMFGAVPPAKWKKSIMKKQQQNTVERNRKRRRNKEG